MRMFALDDIRVLCLNAQKIGENVAFLAFSTWSRRGSTRMNI